MLSHGMSILMQADIMTIAKRIISETTCSYPVELLQIFLFALHFRMIHWLFPLTPSAHLITTLSIPL